MHAGMHGVVLAVAYTRGGQRRRDSGAGLDIVVMEKKAHTGMQAALAPVEGTEERECLGCRWAEAVQRWVRVCRRRLKVVLSRAEVAGDAASGEGVVGFGLEGVGRDGELVKASGEGGVALAGMEERGQRWAICMTVEEGTTRRWWMSSGVA